MVVSSNVVPALFHHLFANTMQCARGWADMHDGSEDGSEEVLSVSAGAPSVGSIGLGDGLCGSNGGAEEDFEFGEQSEESSSDGQRKARTVATSPAFHMQRGSRLIVQA